MNMFSEVHYDATQSDDLIREEDYVVGIRFDAATVKNVVATFTAQNSKKRSQASSARQMQEKAFERIAYRFAKTACRIGLGYHTIYPIFIGDSVIMYCEFEVPEAQRFYDEIRRRNFEM